VDTSFIRQQALFSGTVAGEQDSLHRLVCVSFAFNLVLYLVYLLFAISNTYYLENHLFCFCFLFLSCCLDGVHQSTRGRTGKITKGLR
jgi:hypothetical protein